MTGENPGKSPAGLWILFSLSLAVAATGGVIARVTAAPAWVLLFALGVVGLVIFTVLRARLPK